MVAVFLVLVSFALLSLLGFVYGLGWIKGERNHLRDMTELAESGIETQAELVSLVPFGNHGSAHADYLYNTPNGGQNQHAGVATLGPAHVVGDSYPMVHHPHKPKIVVMGTMANVRREQRMRQHFLKQARQLTLLSVLTGALAVAGILIGPGT
ncbi:hypothetical protein AB0C77_37400 [Streptomyces sp. NPDC048629]|uniref:hypothetical protein n=1 Tax=Streptomyces sp. NPDC048629 TaxID=3154824 RepID=UPI003422AB4C